MKREEVEAIFEGRDLGPIEEHLKALATENFLPTLALGMCLLRMEEAAPALRAVLEKGTAGTTLSDEESRLLFRGVHILGGARDTESFPAMLRLLRRPGQELDDLFGDAIAENFARIIAGLFDGNVDALFAAVGDRSLDEIVRSELLGAATFLTWKGTIPRERIHRLLEGFFERELAESGDVAPDGWLRSIALLGFRDMAAAITRAWQEGRIGDWMVDPDQFERLLSQAERNPDDAERFEDCGLGYVEDVLVALETVDYMRSDEFREAIDDDSALDDDAFGDDIARLPPSEPVRNPWRNVGRNDPCPCGSGKKAKKCCLANNS